MIDDHEAQQALRTVQMCSRAQWRADGYALDLSEYEDAAMEAVRACLETYDPTRGVAFSVYAGYRIRGAVKRAWLRYRTWHELRASGKSGRWFQAPPDAEAVRPRLYEPHTAVDLRLRLARLSVDAQQYARSLWQGDTEKEYAAKAGLTSARWVKARVERWRHDALQGERLP
jgi:hypothetical protein